MLLRPRQELFVANCIDKLDDVGNTLGIAPTGAGKSVMMAAVVAHYAQKGWHSLILQHRDELVAQNEARLRAFAPTVGTGVVNAAGKRYDRQATFAMVQTLSRQDNLSALKPVELVIVDEAHHVVAESYIRIIERALALNPKVKVLGVTATACRGDGRGLRKVFNNVSDIITIKELVQAGHLVRPRTFVIDLGVQDQLNGVHKIGGDYDMGAVAAIMNHQIINAEAVKKWREHASNRKTIAFCSTVEHARGVVAAFKSDGVNAAVLDGETPEDERKQILHDLAHGSLQVVANVSVLTEGFDCPPVSCVLLFRPNSHKSTMIQMIGRGLRVIDPELFPGVVKNDCVVIDYGTSILQHRSLESEIDLEPSKAKASSTKEALECPRCNTTLPDATPECPVCGYLFPTPEEREEANKPIMQNIALVEVDLLEISPFRWEHGFYNDTMIVANAIEAWAACILFRDGLWHAFGSSANTKLLHIAYGDKRTAQAAADDFMREHGNREAANKSKKWLQQPATEKQLRYLGTPPEQSYGLTKYRANCALTLKWNLQGIKTKLLDHEKKVAAYQEAIRA